MTGALNSMPHHEVPVYDGPPLSPGDEKTFNEMMENFGAAAPADIKGGEVGSILIVAGAVLAAAAAGIAVARQLLRSRR